MKRIMLSIAAVALMLFATQTASAQVIVSGGYYSTPYYTTSPVVYSSYTTPVYYSTPVYTYPSYGYYTYPSYGWGGGPYVNYSTRVGSGRLSVGYGSGGWGMGYGRWGRGWGW